MNTSHHTFADFLKWRWRRLWYRTPHRRDFCPQIAQNNPDSLKSNHDKTTLTWIGHATVLLQLQGKNILTDPVFSERVSPVQWAGPKRLAPPGIPLKELPPIDYVTISHDHYDALDENSVLALHRRPEGEKTVFFVPLGLKQWFQKHGIIRVVELAWWNGFKLGKLEIVAVPVEHWSKRGLSEDEALWAGWAVIADNFRFFFAGDSAYTPYFKEIGRRLGPFDLAAIPIGAYEPRWFMKFFHITPEEAVQAHIDLLSRKSVAIHWGTFILTDEPLDEPPRRLERAKREKGLTPEAFVVLKHGETIVLQ